MERRTIEENKEKKRDYAVLVGLRSPVLGADSADEESLAELGALVETAGGEPVGTILQSREKPDPHSFIGEGKVEEVKRMVENSDATMVIFDNDLSPSQIRVLTELCGVQVLDRSGLILDIFAQRAKTKEGCLQVELAQYQYLLPRLVGMWTHLERQAGTSGKGPIGSKGPGETQLETDRRHIHRKIDKLKAELEEVRRVRGTQRQRRMKNEIPVVAIVGYTNAGKSTLLNTLTDAGVLAKDMLFATLDPTSRALDLPDGRRVMLIDTVGLVSRLPHQLVQAFHSTLEEAADADLVLNVCDVSSPEFDQQLEVTTGLLKELGAENVPVLTVLNKCDKLPELPLTLDRKTAAISAKTGMGLEKLLEKVALNLPQTHQHLHLLIPYDKSGLIGEIRQTGKVYTEEYREDGTYLDANVELKLCHRVQEYILLNE